MGLKTAFAEIIIAKGDGKMLKKLIGIILIIGFVIGGTYQSAAGNNPLDKEILRLHVIANSDRSGDQALKLLVKDRVVNLMKAEFAELNNADEAESKAIKKIPRIKAEAQEVIRENGYDYPVQVTVGKYDFPVKSYGNIILPAGNYSAVRIVIGEGQGKNWWCVLFPPLCMVSSSEKGLCLDTPEEAEITFKCLELLPQGLKLKWQIGD